jgi:2,4-dienoyl-CoA reductase-like NADH-dependent reductase (Old Yellow Enzyme family)
MHLATFTYLVRALGKRRIAFICAREAPGEDSIGPQLKQAFGGVWIANERFDRALAEAALAAAVAFGKAFIANPDLPRRFALSAPLNSWNSETFYSAGPEG